MIIMVHKNNYFRDSERISIGGTVRMIKCPYNSIISVRLMSIQVVKSQNGFY